MSLHDIYEALAEKGIGHPRVAREYYWQRMRQQPEDPMDKYFPRPMRGKPFVVTGLVSLFAACQLSDAWMALGKTDGVDCYRYDGPHNYVLLIWRKKR